MDVLDESERDSGLESPVHSKDESPERMPDELIFGGGGTIPIIIKPDKSPVMPEILDLGSDTEPKIENLNAIESYDDEPDETLGERLWGLTEMFPDCVKNATHAITTTTLSGIKLLYSFSRTGLWVVASSSVILFAPVFFELEIAKIEEKQKSEQKQYLLGPSAGMIGTGAAPPPPLPR